MSTDYPKTNIKDKKYEIALEILNSILRREIPNLNLLTGLYGSLTSVIILQIENYFQNFPRKDINIRKHFEITSVISDARYSLEKNLNFANYHSKILTGQVPDIEDLEPVYGIYSENVKNILQLYKNTKLKRRCGIPSAVHPSRTGGIVYTLKFDDAGQSDYCTTAFLHDSIEDLIKTRSKQSDHYGIKGLDIFLDDYIPVNLHSNIRLLTNHYALILGYLKYLLTLVDKHLNISNLLFELEGMCSSNWNMQDKSIKLYDLLKKLEPENPSFDEVKWQSYKELYIKELAENAKNITDFRTFEIKSIDLTDNAHSSGALSMEEKLKNIQKLCIWASYGFSLQTNWQPTNNFIQEVFEIALECSKNLVVKDLLEPISKPDFFASALYKIEELRPVFYIE
ncbi:MAG: hypothetical protein IPM38_15045 [Ignavibacteria bacterium]|nr:hypothetical protein [Ignavibacteria bacterium]